jgi:hypothetical protein
MSFLRDTDVKKHLGRAVPPFATPGGQVAEVEAPVDSSTPATALQSEAIQTNPKPEAV